MENLALFIVIGLCMGFIISYALKPVYHFAMRTKKSSNEVCLWALYVGSLPIITIIITDYICRIRTFGKMDIEHRRLFPLFWIVPYCITCIYYVIRIHKERRLEKNKKESE